LAPKTLRNRCRYRCTIQSILSDCITTWECNCTAHNHRALQRVVRSAQPITGGTLAALQDSYSTRCHRKPKKIIKEIHHPSHGLFTLLPSRASNIGWRRRRRLMFFMFLTIVFFVSFFAFVTYFFAYFVHNVAAAVS
jgi:hypothetical protein